MTERMDAKVRKAASSRRSPLLISRRGLVAGGAAGLVAAPYLSFGSARAQSKEIVLSMSGGTFQKNWQSEIIDPFRKATGLNVKMVSGSVKAHAISLLSSKGATPPFDVFLGNGDDFVKLIEAGLLLPLTPDKCPNLKDVHAKFKDQFNGFGALFDYSSVGIACRTDQVKSPPQSWRELVDRTAAGEFGKSVFFNNLTSGVRGAEVMMTMSQGFGGSVETLDPAFEALKKMKPNVFKFFASFNDPVVLLTNGEGMIGTGWDGRTFIAEDETKGKVRWIRPKEGAASSGPVIGVVKGGNEEAAYKLVDFSLGVEPQRGFCEAMFYGSVNTKVTYSEKLASRIPSIDSVIISDERVILRNISQWIDRWNREIAV